MARQALSAHKTSRCAKILLGKIDMKVFSNWSAFFVIFLPQKVSLLSVWLETRLKIGCVQLKHVADHLIEFSHEILSWIKQLELCSTITSCYKTIDWETQTIRDTISLIHYPTSSSYNRKEVSLHWISRQTKKVLTYLCMRTYLYIDTMVYLWIHTLL